MQIQGLAQVHGPQAINPPHAPRGTAAYESARPAFGADEVSISPLGQMFDRLSQIPDIRADRVNQLRAAIADGNYDSPERVSLALDRLLDEIG